MNKATKEALERIRSGNAWPSDDLLVVLHIQQKDRVVLEELLQKMGLKENDAVEIVPGDTNE